MLPRNLKYGVKNDSAKATSYLANIPAQSNTDGYKAGSVATFYIPVDPQTALCCPESTLKFKVSLVGSGTGRLDACGAHGFIQKVKIYSGSNVIEEIENYGQYVKNMVALQMSQNSMMKHSVTTGMKYDMNTTKTIGVAGSDATTTQTLANALRTAFIDGVPTSYVCNGDTIVYGVEETYTITLASILGSLCNVYFPLFALSAPLRLEITFASTVRNVGAFPSTVTDFTINSLEYIGSMLLLGDEAMEIIKAENGTPLTFSTFGVKNSSFNFALASGSNTQVNFNIAGAKYKSAKSVVVNVRDSATIGTNLYYPMSSHHFNIANYSFRMGSSSSIPAIPPATVPQMFVELLKTTGSYADVNHSPLISMGTYNNVSPTINTATTITQGSIDSGNFMIGLDTERYCSSDKEAIYTGADLSKLDVTCVMNFGAQGGSGVNARFDAFVTYDKELFFVNGSCAEAV
jgi:hypothetical protein